MHGARAYLRVVDKKIDAKSEWARRLKQRRNVNVVVVALAAKHARIAWVIPLCSAKIPSGGDEAVFVMESAENRVGADGIALATAMP